MPKFTTGLLEGWRRRPVRAGLGGMAAALAWLYVAVIPWQGRPWLLDLTTHFALQAATAMLLLAAGLLCWRVRIGGALVLLAGACVLAQCRLGARPPQEGSGGVPLKVVHYNCYGQTTISDESFMSWLRDQDPDLVSLVDPPLGLAARQPWLVERYPYRVEPAPGAMWDVVLLSRFPMELAKLRPDNHPDFVFSFLARRGVIVHVPGGPDLLWSAMHPSSPRNAKHWADSLRAVRRDAPLIVEYLAARKGPVVITGDFNSASTGLVHREFRTRSGLVAWGSVLGAGTWPSWLPGLLRITIDKVWSSGDVTCRSVTVGPAFRSDHLPLVIQLSLPAPVQGPIHPNPEKPGGVL